jgi:hypothetical protein
LIYALKKFFDTNYNVLGFLYLTKLIFLDIEQLKYHFNKIYNVCNNSFIPGCGSYLFNGQEYIYNKEYYSKQKLLYDAVKDKSDVLEIGVYMGHSILIMLLSNPNISITGIDIMDKYSLPAIKYLRDNFPKSKIDFINGDSLKILPNLIKKKRFDFFHIDGQHSNYYATKEFKYCMKINKTDLMSVLFDDISQCKYLKENILKNFNIKTQTTPVANDNLYLEIYINDIKSLIKFNIGCISPNIKHKFIILCKKLISNQVRNRLKKKFPKIINKIKSYLF